MSVGRGVAASSEGPRKLGMSQTRGVEVFTRQGPRPLSTRTTCNRHYFLPAAYFLPPGEKEWRTRLVPVYLVSKLVEDGGSFRVDSLIFAETAHRCRIDNRTLIVMSVFPFPTDVPISRKFH